MSTTHRIIGLKVRRVRTIEAIDMTPPPRGLVKVQGRNKQGKTSLLDSVRMTLEGKKKLHARAVSHGADKATIEIDTGILDIKKTISANGKEALVVKPAGGGVALDAPQSELDVIRGDLEDPTKLLSMSDGDQVSLFLKLSGLAEPLAELQAEYDRVYNERHADGRLLTSAKGELAEIPEPHPADRKRKRIDTADLLAEQQRLNDMDNARNVKAEEVRGLDAAVTRLAKSCDDAAAEVRKAEDALKAAQDKLRRTKIEHQEKTVEASETREAYEAMPVPQWGTIQAKAEEVEANNYAIDNLAKWDQAEAKVKERQAVYDKHTRILDILLDQKRELLASAKFPVDGLSYDGENMLWHGDHLSEISGAQRLQLSVAVAMAQSPDFRALWIKDGDVLDSESLQIIDDMAKANDFQVFIELVVDRDKDGNILYDEDAAIVIEGGEAIAGTAVNA